MEVMKKTRYGVRGQIMIEYALVVFIVVGLSSGLYLFYQGFVQGNLYGSAGNEQNEIFLFSKEYQQLGLQRTTSLPTL